MTSYIIEGVLLVALVATIAGLLSLRRELRQLKTHQASYADALDETSTALITVGSAIREINLQGMTTLRCLIQQIEAARGVLTQLERSNTKAKRGLRD
jgi:hypothetical protein